MPTTTAHHEVSRRVRSSLPRAADGQGWLLADRYVLDLEHPLGAGGQGAVVRAIDLRFGAQPRAIKLQTIEPAEPGDSGDRRWQRFEREGRLLAEIVSPYVLRVWDLGQDRNAGLSYLVTELITGASLEELLYALERPLTEPEALAVARAAARGLAAMHAAGIVHRDFKPGNLLWVAATSELKVCDLGLARDLGEQTLTMPDEVFGTAGYAAPEQLMASDTAGAPADVYSLGATLYAMLSSKLPVSGASKRELLMKSARGELDDVRGILLALGVSEATTSLIERCLSEDPALRPASAAAFLAEASELLTAFPVAGDAEVLACFRGLASRPQPPAPSAARTMTFCEPVNRPENSATVQWANWRGAADCVRVERVPHAASSFFGRQDELQRLAELIADPKVRLITLSGPGGMGKTTLAVRVARASLEIFPGGCAFVEVAAEVDASGLALAVAAALGVPIPPREEPLAAVASILELRPPMLLVLDNLEQILEPARRAITMWLARAGGLKILATSRAVLGLGGEYEIGVTPLSAEDSLALFLERARAVRPGFADDNDGLTCARRIVDELDRHPLALELAAARARILDPARMVERLQKRFELLRAGAGVTARHRTLQSAIEWSYNLLEPWERAAFIQTSAAVGGFTLEAAEEFIDLSAFAQSESDEAPMVMDVLQRLTEQSLLRQIETPTGLRFDSYTSIAEFAALKARSELGGAAIDELHQRHQRAYLRHATKWNKEINAARARQALDLIECEVPNLLAASDRAFARGDRLAGAEVLLAAASTMSLRGQSMQRLPRIEAALSCFVDVMTAPAEHEQAEREAALLLAADFGRATLESGGWDLAPPVIERALAVAREHLEGSHAHALLEEVAGDLERVHGWPLRAEQSYAEARRIHARLGDAQRVASATAREGTARWSAGDFPGALAAYAEAEVTLRELGHRHGLAMLANNRAIVQRKLGDLDGALVTLAQAEACCRELGNRPGIATSLLNRGNIEQDRGDDAAALAAYAEAETVFRELGQKSGIALAIGNRGTTLWALGEREGALACYRDAGRLARELGEKLRVALQMGNLGRCLFEMGRCEEALAPLIEAVEIYEETGVHGTPAFGATSALAMAEEERGRMESARVHARRAIELAEELALSTRPSESPRRHADNLRTLAEVRRIAAS